MQCPASLVRASQVLTPHWHDLWCPPEAKDVGLGRKYLAGYLPEVSYLVKYFVP